MAGYALTEEQVKYFDTAIAPVLRGAVIGRLLIPLAFPRPLGFGVQKVTYNTMKDMSPAQLSMTMGENIDIAGMIENEVSIPIIHKEFQIPRRTLESSKRSGVPLDTSSAELAAEQAAISDNELIVMGGMAIDSGNYSFDGLYTAADNDYSTTMDWGTAGNATTAVKGAIKLLLKAKVQGPFNLVINEDQYAEVLGPRSTSSDRTELAVVRDLLMGGDGNGQRTPFGPGGGGNIYVNPIMETGTGLVLPAPNKKYADLIVAQDMTTEYEILSKSRDLFGRVWESVVPRIKRPEAFCKLSDI